MIPAPIGSVRLDTSPRRYTESIYSYVRHEYGDREPWWLLLEASTYQHPARRRGGRLATWWTMIRAAAKRVTPGP